MSAAATGASVTAVQAARVWLRRVRDLPDEGLHVWSSQIAEVPIRFRCSDPALAELYRARLVGAGSAAPGEPALRLDLIETEATGWPAPQTVVDRPADPAALARQFAAARISALTPPPQASDRRYPWIFFTPSTGHGVILVPRADDLPPWTAGAPFAPLLHFAFAWRGWRLMHAASLGCATAHGALLAGPGGVGKSATTLAGIAHGLTTVGDDYLLVAPGAPPRAWPVYRLAKQDPVGLARLGRTDLAQGEVNWHGKVEVDLDAAFPGRMTDRLALAQILLPRLAGAPRTSVTPVTPTDAFSAIAASMLTQLPGARRSGFSFLTRLTRSLPAYRLTLSDDPREIAGTLRELLAR